jgi:adenine/guanine phosphoribosyltransferase-like PRPP-binding protein
MLLDSGYFSSVRQSGRLVLRGAGMSISPAVRRLIDALRDVLTLPAPDDVDYAIALDWTKQPIEGEHPHAWPNTRIYDLVHKGKYWYKTPSGIDQQRQVGRALTTELLTLIDRHPLLRTTDAVVAVPGHDAKVVSFGSRLAASVAYQRGVRFESTRAVATFRTPAKTLDLAERAEVITGKFVCGADLSGADVVIVDDLYSSGTTAAETARVVRLSGARRVAVLCAVRTLRSR